MRIIRLLLPVSICFFLFTTVAFSEPDRDPFYTKGNPLSNAPSINGIYENVDPFSGNLKIVQTDFELPQNGGLELKIMRYYDGAIWGKVTSLPNPVDEMLLSPLGLGWNMHFGALIDPSGPNPVFVTQDGSQHVFYDMPVADDPTGFKKISKDFAILNTDHNLLGFSVYQVTMPNGMIYTFEKFDGVGNFAYVKKIENASQKASIDFYYTRSTNANYPYNTYFFLNIIVDSVGRSINFQYDVNNHLLLSLEVENQSYIYNHMIPTTSPPYLNPWRYALLTSVDPPEGNSWVYDYEHFYGAGSFGTSGNELGLKRITYPTEGTIDYTYKIQSFPVGSGDVNFRVIDTRTTGGRNVTSGTWSYDYNTPSYGQNTPNTTTVTGPNNRVETYKYFGWGNCVFGDV